MNRFLQNIEDGSIIYSMKSPKLNRFFQDLWLSRSLFPAGRWAPAEHALAVSPVAANPGALRKRLKMLDYCMRLTAQVALSRYTFPGTFLKMQQLSERLPRNM